MYKIGDKVKITSRYSCACLKPNIIYTIKCIVKIGSNSGEYQNYITRYEETTNQCVISLDWIEPVSFTCTCGISVCSNCKQYRGN